MTSTRLNEAAGRVQARSPPTPHLLPLAHFNATHVLQVAVSEQHQLQDVAVRAGWRRRPAAGLVGRPQLRAAGRLPGRAARRVRPPEAAAAVRRAEAPRRQVCAGLHRKALLLSQSGLADSPVVPLSAATCLVVPAVSRAATQLYESLPHAMEPMTAASLHLVLLCGWILRSISQALKIE